MKIIITLLVVSLLLVGCSNPEGTTRTLQGMGMTDIDIKGYAFFGCSDREMFHTHFTAKGPSGNHVEGVACSSWLSGTTIRTY